jgi:hypothetical protein
MKSLNVSDSNDFLDFNPLDEFYADPEFAQTLCRNIFTEVFKGDFEPYAFKGLFYTSINRYFLADIKILEHPLLVQNIIKYCKENGCLSVNFKIHKSNIELYRFYAEVLAQHDIKANLEFHDSAAYWVNSLTKEDFSSVVKGAFKRLSTVLAQFTFLLVNSILPKDNIKSNKVVFWHSFANNREKIDHKFIDKLEAEGITTIHPNPYIYKSISKWNRPIYFLGKYSISPWKYLGAVLSFACFRKSFNKVLEQFPDYLPYYPKKWNYSNMTKTFFFMLYNLLENAIVENVAKNREAKTVNVFRGGAAAGLIYSGISKTKYKNENVTGVLVPHGTEFNVIDHFSYFFLDYNILPSELIKQNWDNQLNSKFHQDLKYNQCKLIAGGRIDYELLNANLGKRKATGDKIQVGIVLTYNSETYQNTYISDIKDAFEKRFGKGQCTFIIKPRPNRVFKPGNYMDENVIVSEGDIYSFLNTIDIIAGTVSTFGILTMVVTDGIYSDIPGFYYIPNPKFNKDNLGYSYHQSMESYTFNSKDSLENYLENYENKESLIANLWDRNISTKKYLVFDESADEFLNQLILKSFN